MNNIECDRCEGCENDERWVNCANCKECNSCELNMDVMRPPKLKGHSVVVASQGIILYGGITWPDVDMTISDAILKQL